MIRAAYFLTLFLSILVFSCGEDVVNDEPITVETESDDILLSSAFDEFDTDNVTISLDGTDVIIESNGHPNHPTPYWPTTHELYQDPIDPNFDAAPGTILNYTGTTTLTVPAVPTLASRSTATSLGAIGIAVSGAVIYNDQEGPNVPLDFPTANSLDYTAAHTGPQSYHYHAEPVAWSEDDDKLIGIMADGFFLYGRRCASTGGYPTDLDASGGHYSTTQHSNEPHYHYHIQNELYINTFYLLFPGDYQGIANAIFQ
ncbi:MAG: YHYH protein [Bacteroidota bacterium]